MSQLRCASYNLYVDVGWAIVRVDRTGRMLSHFEKFPDYEFHGEDEARRVARAALLAFRRQRLCSPDRLRAAVKYNFVDKKGEIMDCEFEYIHEDGTVEEAS